MPYCTCPACRELWHDETGGYWALYEYISEIARIAREEETDEDEDELLLLLVDENENEVD